MISLRRGLSGVGTMIFRNRVLVWFVIFSILIGALAIAPTPLRTKLWCICDGLSDRVISVSGSSFRSDIENERPDPKIVTIELQSAGIRQMLADAAGLPMWRIEGLSITVEDGGWSTNRPMPTAFRSVMELYLQSRCIGHTQEYTCAVITSLRAEHSMDKDFLTDLRKLEFGKRCGEVIPERYVSRVVKEIVNNRERVVGFVVIDGSLAWQHQLFYSQDGSLVSHSASRVDVMEFDPNLASLMKEADDMVGERMKKEKISGMGSCHTFWRLKQEFLRSRGYDWKSPSELNPHICYD